MTIARRPPPPLARVAFFDGVPLAHGDLRDVVAHEARMLALHVLGAHRTWGIAIGLAATLDAARRAVHVSSGAAFTRTGEVLAIAATNVPAPIEPTPGEPRPTFDLLLRAAPPAPAACTRSLACDGAALPVPRVELRWVRAHTLASGATLLGDDVAPGTDIPITRAVREPDGRLTGPDGSERRLVRGLVRPHVASGVTRVGQLDWTVGTIDVSASVDTSAGGFGTVPVYQATLGGVAAGAGALVGPWLHVEQATARSFTAHLVAGASPAQPMSAILEQLLGSVRTATISWIGVETTHGCGALSKLSTLLDAVLALHGGASNP